ncbi:AbrB/MazE/SpoVT family DNA-binding domain-containing protein [Candidatus Nitrospira nitrosa]|nr:hypothetical protein [Candidatus Nitrospira nitrosa]
MQMKFPVNACWLLLPIAVSLTTGCNSIPQNVALGAVIGTGVGAVIPGHDIEQVYYLGSFDPQEQVPPALYRVRVRGQASIISWMRFGSGWVPAELIDSLGSSVEIDKKDGKIVMTKAKSDELSKLTIGRRLMQFGPEGFREVPKDHRLVILMGSSPDKFFKAMDEALGAVTQAKIDQDSRALNGLLFEAITNVRAEKHLVEAQLEAAKDQFPKETGAQP